MHGFTVDEMMKMNLKDLDTPETSRLSPTRIQKILAGESMTFEVEHFRKSGQTIPIEVSASLVTIGGSKHLLGFHRDITDRKQMIGELINAKEKAEESDRLKSAFLANMSHEIRTPMNGILGFANLLKEPDLTVEEQKEYIGIIEKSSSRLLNIITDIVNISKIEAEQMEVSISETNVNQQIEFISTLFRSEVEKKGMQLLVTNPLPPNECRVTTDREKLYAILTNLVGNALKYTSLGYIEFGVEKKGNFLEFFVRDTGVGIPENQREIIFERFRQGNDLITKPYEGTGLGLSISKAFVELLGGKIWLESQLGEGSTFYFTIPHNVDEEVNHAIKKGSANTETDHQDKDLKVLIVEDDESSVFFLSTALKKDYGSILIARTGVEAVEACRNNPDIDLVLMDVRMPNLDGYSATRQIRQFNQGVVIIAQTAYAMAGDREKAMEAGCNDHISKPIRIDVLKELIRKHFNK
jgi:signal transduction histidine kinase/ActR/RegA family two-component response regulator